MRQIIPSRFLIDEQRNGNVIASDLRLPIEVISSACKAISVATGKGSLGSMHEIDRINRDHDQ